MKPFRVSYLISLFQSLTLLPSYVQAACAEQKVGVTFYGFPDNNGNAKIGQYCGRKFAGGE